MTRKDYRKMAAALSRVRPVGIDSTAHTQWQDDCAALADVLRADNPRFDRMRFLDACGWNVGTYEGVSA